jgi:hypothetical protein
MVALVFATLLLQAPEFRRVLPDHVRLIEPLKPGVASRFVKGLVQRRERIESQPCSTMIVIPVDPAIDPKMAIVPSNVPSMPSFRGQEPCYNKLP